MDDAYPSDEEHGFGGPRNRSGGTGGGSSPDFLADYGFRGYGRYISTSFQRA